MNKVLEDVFGYKLSNDAYVNDGKVWFREDGAPIETHMSENDFARVVVEKIADLGHNIYITVLANKPRKYVVAIYGDTSESDLSLAKAVSKLYLRVQE